MLIKIFSSILEEKEEMLNAFNQEKEAYEEKVLELQEANENFEEGHQKLQKKYKKLKNRFRKCSPYIYQLIIALHFLLYS